MANISAKDVMGLRNQTGLAMMECKKALVEADGNLEKAEELLRKKLKGKMEGKSDRVAGEGRIGIAIDGNTAAIVEIKAETDFTAKNEKFVDVTNQIAKLALAGAGEPTDEMKAVLDDLRISTGENISIGRMEKLEGNGSFGQYVHHDGKTGVLVQASAEASDEVMKQIAMHVTAAHPRPLGLTPDDIPSAMVEKERKFRIEQAIESGKPEQIAEKMVEGGMKKFFSEVALLEQPFVMDPSKKIKDLLSGDTTLTAFFRMQVGEGS